MVLAGLKCSPLYSFQKKGRHFLVHWECLQGRLRIFEWIGEHVRVLILHPNLPQVHLGDFQWGSPPEDSSHLGNRGTQMSQGLQTRLYCRRFPMTITMQMTTAMNRHTWAVQKANRQLVWRKPNSPWSNLPNGCGRPTTVCWTSGRKSGWLGFWRRIIIPLSGVRTVSNSFKVECRTGRHR